MGAYHSHPDTDPEPSSTDLAEANDPAPLCVIVSPRTRGAQVGAFRVVGSRFVQVALVVGDSSRRRTT